jgi:hypothetical protein
MSTKITFVKVLEVTETMAPEINFPAYEQINVEIGNDDYCAVITVRDNKRWREYILKQLLELWKNDIQESIF